MTAPRSRKKLVLGLVAAVVGLPLAAIALVFAASELGGEVVVLRTSDGQGGVHETHLWIVEDAGAWWLRAGMPDSAWLARLREHPQVEVVRDGRALQRSARPVPAMRERIHERMRERYGLADAIVSAMRDGSASVPVRLDPPDAAARGVPGGPR